MTVVRVRDATHHTLAELAGQQGRAMGDVVDDAVEQYRRAVILDLTDSGYAAWRAANPTDPDDRVLEGSLRDGLTD